MGRPYPAVSVTHRCRRGFGGYLFVVHGDTEIPGAGTVYEGGGARIWVVGELALRAGANGAEVLLIDTKLR